MFETDSTLKKMTIYVPNCHADKIIKSSHVCTRCKKFWCENCKKFDLHTEHLVKIEHVEKFIENRREFFLDDLKNSVREDPYYLHLEKLDTYMNKKISEIEIQFDEMIETILKIKEGQISFLKDYFSKEIGDVKKFISILDEVTFFETKFKEIKEIEEKDGNLNISDYLKNNDILEDYKSSITEIFSEFKNKLNIFDNIHLETKNFNQKFNLQLESKSMQCESMIKNISKNFHNRNEISIRDNKEINYLLNNSKSELISPCIYKVKYYNTILEWDHVKKKMSSIVNFKDKSNFKTNYQVYSGNIFLNHANKLFIVTGTNFNLFYYFDKETNEIISLPYLSHNHCRGSLVYIRGIESIVCISGKYTNKCEILSLKNFQNFYSESSAEKLATMHEKSSNKPGNNSLEKIKENLSSTDRHLRSIEKDMLNELDTDDNNHNIMHDKDNQEEIELKVIDEWQAFPALNYQRHCSSVYVYNDNHLYIFFGYNTARGSIDTIERININNFSQSSNWEILNYINSTSLDMRLHSHCCIFANFNEIYIAGGAMNEKFSEKIYKYNLINNSIYLTDITIPGIQDNEYYRFWEESQFIPYISHDFKETIKDEDYILGMFDARNKMHLFNARTFKYEVI